jgi:hypothetical protein
MPSVNGETEEQAPLELGDVLHIQTTDGKTIDFEVVGILQDPDAAASYAVLWSEGDEDEGQFIVSDLSGNLLDDDDLAQQILDDFLASAEEDDEDAPGQETD